MTPRIAVTLSTLGGGRRVFEVLSALRNLSSADAAVHYHVVINEDDTVTREAAYPMPDVTYHIGPAEVPWPQRQNQAVMAHADAWDWLMWWPDDVWPLAFEWDRIIAGLDPAKHPLVTWRDTVESETVVMPVMHKRYVKALGRPFVPYFPFWFLDIWIEETHRLAFGCQPPFVEGLRSGVARRDRTRNLRDLAFWVEHFIALRPERLAEAQRVQNAFGSVHLIAAEAMDTIARWDEAMRARVPVLEEAFQDAGQGAAPPSYQLCKQAAEARLATVSNAREGSVAP